MPKLRAIRDCLLLFHDEKLITDEEFLFLYDVNQTKNPDFPHWLYDSFDLDKLSDSKCKEEFRFLKGEIYDLKEILDTPDEIICYNRLVVDGIEVLCILLKRFAYPIRYSYMIPIFGRPVPQYGIIKNMSWITSIKNMVIVLPALSNHFYPPLT